MYVTRQALEASAKSPDALKIIDAAKSKNDEPAHEGIEPLQTAPKPWGPLPGREPPGPFPLEAMPPLANAMARTVADSVQVSFDMAACMVLGAVSAAAAGRVSVQVNGTHSEPCHLFIAVGADPSERKSACMKAVFEGLYRFEKEENERRAPLVRQSVETVKMLEEGIARARKAEDRKQLAELLEELGKIEEVKPYELILTDTTPEALSRAMARNGGRMAVVSSEGAFFNILAGSYTSSGAVNVDVVLKGYSGEPVRVERVGRPGEKIDRACLSLCLAVQPEMLQDFLTNQTLAARGMSSRFLACMPRTAVGARREEGIPASIAILELFATRMEELMKAREPLTLPMSPEAREVFKEWFAEVENDLKAGGELKSLGQGWGGKLCGNTARLAGLMTLMRDEHRAAVSGETMRGAIQVARWFRDQALKLMAGEKELSPEANEALAWLIRNGEGKISARKVKNALRKRKSFQKTQTVELALLELGSAGYVQVFTPPRNETGGRPSGDMVAVHPGLLKQDGEAAETAV